MNLRKALWAGNLALLVLLGYVVAAVFFGEKARQQTITQPGPVHIAAAAASAPHVIEGDCSAIAERNIFASGKVSAVSEEPSKTGPAPAVKTQLQLRLLGTVAGDAEVARAVIEDMTTKVQDLYKTGDIVQGARVERIERNRVILMHGTRREILELYLASGEPPKGETAGAKVASRQPDLRGAVNVISPTEFEINKKALLARIGGVAAIVKSARLTPHVVEGKTKGLRITGLKDMSMARFVGLQEGDVVQVVNGQELTSPQKAFQVFRKAKAQSSLTVQLLRGKEKKTLSFRIH